jgi:hypothetical protein
MKLLLRRQGSPLDALDDLILSYLVAAERRGSCPIVAQIERVTGIHHATARKRLDAMRQLGIAALSVAKVWQALPMAGRFFVPIDPIGEHWSDSIGYRHCVPHRDLKAIDVIVLSRILAEASGFLSLRRIGEDCGISRPTSTASVGRLTTAGFLVLTGGRDKDGRQAFVIGEPDQSGFEDWQGLPSDPARARNPRPEKTRTDRDSRFGPPFLRLT